MILLFAILIGMIAGLLRARLQHRLLQTFALKHNWLLLTGILPLLLTLQIPQFSTGIPERDHLFVLISSYLLLTLFAWLNRDQPGFWLIFIGLLLNLSAAILQSNATFYWFSDRIILPGSNGFCVALSPGNTALSLGTLLHFWSLGGPINEKKEFTNVLHAHT